MDDYNEQNTDFHPTPEIFSGSPARAPARRGRLLPNGRMAFRPCFFSPPKVGKMSSSVRYAKNAELRATLDAAGIDSERNLPRHLYVYKTITNTHSPTKDLDPTLDELRQSIIKTSPAWKYTSEENKLIIAALHCQQSGHYAPFTWNLTKTLLERAETLCKRNKRPLKSVLHKILSQDLRREFGKSVEAVFALEAADKGRLTTGRIHAHGFLVLPTLDGKLSGKDADKAHRAFHRSNGTYEKQGDKNHAIVFSGAYDGIYWASRYMLKHQHRTRRFIDERLIAMPNPIRQAARDYYEEQIRVKEKEPAPASESTKKGEVSQPTPTLRDIKPRSGAITASQGDEIASTATHDAKTSERSLKTLSEAPIKPNPTPKKADYFPDPLGRTKPPGMSDIEWLTHPDNPGRNKGITLSNDVDLDDFFAELDNVAASIPPD